MVVAARRRASAASALAMDIRTASCPCAALSSPRNTHTPFATVGARRWLFFAGRCFKCRISVTCSQSKANKWVSDYELSGPGLRWPNKDAGCEQILLGRRLIYPVDPFDSTSYFTANATRGGPLRAVHSLLNRLNYPRMLGP